jgi:hypothetical protein
VALGSRIFAVGAVSAVLFVTLFMARVSRRSMREAIARSNEALLMAQQREAQLAEAHGGISENLGAFFLSEVRPAIPAVSEILLQQGTYTIPSLLQATCRLRLRDVMISIRSLIGLGHGLTPSGDDFLVGYMAGLWCTARANPSRMRFLTALESELSEVSRNTNKISSTFLRSAAKGHVSEPIAKLAQQLNQANDMSSLRATTQTALQVGHTSGSDGVLGMLLGCLVWQGLPPHLILSDLLRVSLLHDSTAQR